MAEGGQNLNSEDDDPHKITMGSEFNTESLIKADENDTYEVAGGKCSLHGIAYQKKLLMLFALRSYKKHKKFKLATEMKKADKVDDVILMSPKVDGPGNVYRFLQAKHRSGNVDNMRKISAEDLLKEPKGQFSIPMYFQSYLKIVRKFLAEGDEIKDIIICTNGGLEVGSLCKGFTLTYDIFKVIDEDDFIFGKTLRKLKEEFSGRRAMVSLLMNCFSKFPDNFAKSISFDRTYNHSLPVSAKDKDIEIERLYEIVFLEEVVNLKSKSFREDFVIGVNLTGIGKHFRRSLLLEWERLDKEGCFEDWLKSKVVNVNGISEDHGLNVKLVAESVRKNFTKKVIEIQDKKSLLYKNMETLKLMDVLEETEEGLRFSKSFLNSDDLCGTATNFRSELINRLSNFKIDLNALEEIKFELKEKRIQSKNITIHEFNPIQYVTNFLSMLVLALDQPNEEKLGIMIRDELKTVIVGRSVDSAYNKLYTCIDEWLSSPVGIFLTEGNFKTIFDDSNEEVMFEVRDPVSNFTGRLKELNELHEVLFQKESIAANIWRTATISGLRGIGKSELVRVFAKIHKKKFDNIIWIDSETKNTMESSFRRLAYERLDISRKISNAEEKRIEFIVEYVYKNLKGKRNLFIFDNVEEFRGLGEGINAIKEYFSQSSEENLNYHIITSRNRKWEKMKVIDLHKFTDDEAMEFFKVSLGDLEDSDSKEFSKLADALGNFPLAMQQAVAFIKETSDEFKTNSKQYKVSDYLENFKIKSKLFLEHEFPYDSDDQYTRTTCTNLKLAIEAISPKEHGLLSIKILNIISYLQPDNIDSSLFSRIFQSEDDRHISKALLLLQQYSLVSFQGNIIRIHRLLQLVIRINLKDKYLEKETLISILQSWEYLPLGHLMSVWNYVDHFEELIGEYASLPQDIIRSLCTSNQPELAVSFGRKMERIYRNIFGVSHQYTARVRYLFAAALAFNGEWKESYQWQQSNFVEQRETVGDQIPFIHPNSKDVRPGLKVFPKSDDEEILKDVYLDKILDTAKISLAFSKYNEFNFDEALQIFQEVIQQREETYSFVPDEIVIVAQLMIDMIRLKRNEDFKSNYYQFTKKYEEILGSTDKFFLRIFLSALDEGFCSKITGFITKTFRIYYDRFKESYGENDLDLLEWRMWYGVCLLQSSYVDESLTELLEIYEKQRSLLDEKHQNVLNTRIFIAKALCRIGNHQEALRIYQEILAISKEVYGENHVSIINSVSGICLEHSHLEEYDRALEIMEGITNRNISNNFIINQSSYNVLVLYASILRKAGQYNKAAEKYSEIIKLQNEWFGERCISTLTIRLVYSNTLNESGNRKKSLEILNEILCHLKEMDVGGDMLEELFLNELLSDTLRSFEMYEEEKAFRLKALDTLDKLFDRRRPRTLLTVSKLAIVECKLGNFQTARELLKDIERNFPTEQNQDDYAEVHLMVVELLYRLKDFKECSKRIEMIQKMQGEMKKMKSRNITQLRLNMAIVMADSGKVKDSLKIFSDICANQSSSLDSDHGKSLREIIMVLLQKKDYKNALKHCKQLLDIEKRKYGEEGVETLKTKSLLAQIFGWMGRFSESLNSLKFCHRLMCVKLGEDDEQTLRTKYLLACALCNTGEMEQGMEYLFEVYKKQKSLFGEKHKYTVNTKEFLEAVFRSESFQVKKRNK